MPDLMVAGIDEEHFLRALDDEGGLDDEKRESGHAAGQARPTWGRADFSREHARIVPQQRLPHPGLQIRIVGIGHTICRLARLIVTNEGMLRIEADGLWTARHRSEIRIDRE